MSQILNREIDYRIIVEAGHSRSYEWPDRERDSKSWGLLSKIYKNRLLYPYSSGDYEVDTIIKRILEETQH